jgi:hypothetical protein
MPQRIASIMALIAFALCLLIGVVQAQNSFGTTVVRALGAMLATFVIGLIVGMMAQKMLDENLRGVEEKLKNEETKPQPSDR